MNEKIILNISAAVIDGRATAQLEEGLRKVGVRTVIRTERYYGLYEAIAYHPDIMLHHLGDKYMLYAPGTSVGLLKALRTLGMELIAGETILTGTYPGNIAYNLVRVGNYAFHNLKYTDPVLKRELLKRDVELVNVKQGYSKCSVSVVDERSIITADAGIAEAAEKKGVEALLIEPEMNIILEGMDYGFIGGSTCLLGKNIWALTGDINKLQASEKIKNYLSKKGFSIISLTAGNIVDIGSIIVLN